MKTRKKNNIIYLAVVLFAALFLYVGNTVASDGWGFGYGGDGFYTAEARVTAILDVTETWHTEWISDVQFTFEAVVTRGAYRNTAVTATQVVASYFAIQPNEVAEGDRVVLVFAYGEWHFLDHVRINTVLVLGAVFAALLLLFGRMKGFNAILSLGFTCAAIFAVFLPSILSGRNIYASAVAVCVYSVVVTLFIVNGVNKKSLAAVAGCLGGIITAALLTLAMGAALRLTGMVSRDFEALLFLPTENPIDLNAVIFAGIIIGAVGAVMDVAVSIASALWELKARAPGLPFSGFLKSGINIGRDIMSSMTNTLVLAYIGGSLSVILLLLVYTDSFTDLLNRELVIVELLKAIIGGMGILLTMPLTALACAAMYSSRGEPCETDEMEEYLAALGRSLGGADALRGEEDGKEEEKGGN